MGENFYGDVIFSATPHTLTRGFTKGSRKIAKKKREMLSLILEAIKRQTFKWTKKSIYKGKPTC